MRLSSKLRTGCVGWSYEDWAWNVERMTEGFERGYCFSNNHFAGFAPETIITR